jgi:rRNA small subunit pseudouridine methyltransferase Nep1
LILAESALELVPKKIFDHPTIVSHSKKSGKSKNELLLDRSYHHKAMVDLKDAEKRGRPDIIHMVLLEALGTPLNKEGLLRIYVHTIDDHIIKVSSKARLPKNYNRFISLLEQLYKLGRVPESGETLLSIKKAKLQNIIDRINPSKVIVFSLAGKPNTPKKVCKMILHEEKPLIIIGGFPHGRLTNEIFHTADYVFSIDRNTLEAPIVTSRIIYEYEVAIGLDQKRVDLKTQGK